MRRRDFILFASTCTVAAVIPLLQRPAAATAPARFPGWPAHYDGKPLQQLPLTSLERRFQEAFPGRLGRFSDGEREIILRWVVEKTRMLHPAMDCFKGSGYEITHPTVVTDSQGRRWGKFTASHGKTLAVSERIYDARGGEWTDVSSWYWSATPKESSGPWWAVTVAETAG